MDLVCLQQKHQGCSYGRARLGVRTIQRLNDFFRHSSHPYSSDEMQKNRTFEKWLIDSYRPALKVNKFYHERYRFISN